MPIKTQKPSATQSQKEFKKLSRMKKKFITV